MSHDAVSPVDLDAIRAELPLRHWTPAAWADVAAADLDAFLADHAVCEQQAALFGLSLIGHYPEDAELVRLMGNLAAEEVAHLRRVATLLDKRGAHPAKKRTNPWVAGLRSFMRKARADELKVDRLLVGALIEARSCERFSCLLARLEARGEAPEVARLLHDLGPAEKRHWQMFHRLAERELPAAALAARWDEWLDHEAALTARGGREPRVHG